MKNIAIITAAGMGTRMSLSVPKQFYEIDSKPLIIYTVETFQKCKKIDEIIIVTIEDRIDYVKNLCKEYNITKLTGVIVGGNTNGESIYNGIIHVNKTNTDCNIIIHDGDRCLLGDDILINNIECVENNGSAVTVIPMVEEVFMGYDNKSVKHVSRKDLFRIQTPYSYRMKDLIEMYEEGDKQGFDYKNIAPCILMQNLNKESYLINGSELNFKITHAEDLELFMKLKNN